MLSQGNWGEKGIISVSTASSQGYRSAVTHNVQEANCCHILSTIPASDCRACWHFGIDCQCLSSAFPICQGVNTQRNKRSTVSDTQRKQCVV